MSTAKIRRHPDGPRILAAIRIAKKNGWTIVPGSAFAHEETATCCALGALTCKDGQDFYEAAELVLGWPYEKAWAFAHGFDSASRPLIDDESKGRHAREFQLGIAVRRWLDPGVF